MANIATYRLLDQVFSLPLSSERYLVYAPLHRLAFVANGALVNEVYEYLQQAGESTALVTASPDSASQDHAPSFLFGLLRPVEPPPDEYAQSGVSYDSVVLFLTNQCSLRCSYCYASAGEHFPETMPWEVAKAGIEFVVQEALANQKPSIALGFHGGGEPTLNWDVLKQSVEYTRNAIDRCGLGLTVSGAFNAYWPEYVTRYVMDNFTELSISFDGLPEIQDKQRRTKNGRGSYARVAKTLHRLDEARFPYGIRMTVTDESVHHLWESISHICENFSPHTIQVEPVFPQGRARAGGSALTEHNAFISQFIKAFWTSNAHDIRLFYSGARPEILTQRFCLAACRALVVTPTGSVTTCFEVYSQEHPLGDRFMVGRYNGKGGFDIDDQKLSGLVACKHHHPPECFTCFCKWHCAGDCATKAPPQDVNTPSAYTDRCLATQELTKFLLLHMIKESGGFIWHEP